MSSSPSSCECRDETLEIERAGDGSLEWRGGFWRGERRCSFGRGRLGVLEERLAREWDAEVEREEDGSSAEGTLL
jgi:hypothetical protein